MDKARLALELEHYIRDYTPEGWKESIETAMFVPWVSVVDINRILNNDIPTKFKDHKEFMEAVQSWLKKKWPEPVIDEKGVFINGIFEPWEKIED
jgi:hypothetical protein